MKWEKQVNISMSAMIDPLVKSPMDSSRWEMYLIMLAEAREGTSSTSGEKMKGKAGAGETSFIQEIDDKPDVADGLAAGLLEGTR